MFVSLGAMQASLAFEGRLRDAIFRCCVSTLLAAIGGMPRPPCRAAIAGYPRR